VAKLRSYFDRTADFSNVGAVSEPWEIGTLLRYVAVLVLEQAELLELCNPNAILADLSMLLKIF